MNGEDASRAVVKTRRGRGAMMKGDDVSRGVVVMMSGRRSAMVTR